MEIALVLGLLLVGVVLFWKEVFSVDIVTLILLVTLILFGILTPDEAFSGFSSDIIIILAAVFIISGAVQRTGLVDVISAQLMKFSGKSPSILLVVMMSDVGGVSAFMNNTTVTALFLAPVRGVARRMKVSPSKLLMPLAYASILGGTCTLIGTSTNMAVNAYMKNVGMKPFGLFEITPVGLIVLGVGIAYMLTIGRLMLPDHPEDNLTGDIIREYISEIVVLNDSHMVGQRLYESELAKLDFQIIRVIRAKKKLLPDRSMTIHPGDILLIKAKADELMKVKSTAGIEIKPELKLDEPSLQSENIKIAEVLIPPRSDLINCTLKDVNFRQKYGVTALALYRHGHSLKEKIKNVRLRLGDLLLIQGTPERVDLLRHNPSFAILEELNPSLYRKKKGLLAAAFFGAAVLVGGMGWMPLSVAFLAAAVFTVLSGCLRVEEAYEFIDWRLLILIGGMTAFGKAMEKTGAAEWLASNIVNVLGPLGPSGIMAGFFILTIFLTQPMSNAAAALVVLPIAIKSAHTLGVSDRTFAVAVMFAASVSFITPLEPSCILVYGPGKYRFADFVKTGIALTAILVVIIYFLIPRFWPFHPAV